MREQHKRRQNAEIRKMLGRRGSEEALGAIASARPRIHIDTAKSGAAFKVAG
ncbi:hypothetical protein BURKHO8Y_10391 [Burkholderia sp. 8Y]|nr:hypothetical protein BURKHO8Y_10391 [Burkholderia sp. 8Y]